MPFVNTVCVCHCVYIYIALVHVAGESQLKSYENKVSQNIEDVARGE